MINERASGILLHPTSFPGKYGVGDLGETAYNFVDFLFETSQKLWQILPLGSVNESYSPYQSTSAFAGNCLLISLEKLVYDGLLTKADLSNTEKHENRINYEFAMNVKIPALRKAYDNFKKVNDFSDYYIFCDENNYWLDDYALFVAVDRYIKENKDKDGILREHFNKLDKNFYTDEFCGGMSWNNWPVMYRYGSDTIPIIKNRLAEEISFNKFVQYIFFSQWMQLKKYANSKGIKIIDDIPMYMPLHSADVWANPNLFLLDDDLKPSFIAGCAPDDGCPTGQSFGNCIYDWEAHKKSNYRWWIHRFKFALKAVDIIRLDYFTGYEFYWAIPLGENNPAKGSFYKANGKNFFKAVLGEISDSSIIIEDIGPLKQEVIELRDSLGFPSMKIMQFGKNTFRTDKNLPHNFSNTNCVLYTGTHDNNTILGWYKDLDIDTKEIVNKIFGSEDVNWGLIKYAFSSIAKYVIVPLQDIIGLDEQYRMNLPRVVNGSWRFQYNEKMLNETIKSRLKQITYLYNR